MKMLPIITAVFLLSSFGSCSSSTSNTSDELKTQVPTKMQNDVNVQAASNTKVSTKTNTNDDVVYGDYLMVTVSNPDMEKVRSVFKGWAFSEFKLISHNIIKIKFDKDPGLKELESKIKGCKDIKSIEPNRIVRIPAPVN